MTKVINDSQGTTINFAGTIFDATSIKAKFSQPTVDASTLTLASGAARRLQAAPLKDGDSFTVEFLGANIPLLGQSGALAIGGGIGASGNAICEEVEITAAVGELLKGTCTIRMLPEEEE